MNFDTTTLNQLRQLLSDDCFGIVLLSTSDCLLRPNRESLHSPHVLLTDKLYDESSAYYSGDDQPVSWHDLGSRCGDLSEMKVQDRFKELDEHAFRAISNWYDGAYEVLVDRMRDRAARWVVNDVIDDLLHCTLVRASFGRSIFLIEEMVAVYSNGGLPCGWTGRYPDGQIIAYSNFPKS